MPERPALDPKSSYARIRELERQLDETRLALFNREQILGRLWDYADTFDDRHDGMMPKAGVVAILAEAEGGFTLRSTTTGKVKHFS